MSEYVTKAPRVQEISRQFTDAERAIDDRITGHLQAPVRVAYGDRSTGYAWLEEDLKLRSAITAQLGQEQALAGAQSVRQELDKKWTQDTEDEADAISATREINSLIKANPNMTHKDAILAVTQDRPDRWGNKKFIKYTNQLGPMHETDMERQKREGDLQTSIIDNKLKGIEGTARLEVYNSPEGKDYITKRYQLIMEKEKNGFELDARDHEVKMMVGANDLKEQRIRSQMIDFTDPTLTGKSRFVQLADQAGIEVTNLDAMGSYLQGRKEVMDVIAHPTFLSRKPEMQARLGDALKIIQMGDEAKPEDKRRAEVEIARVTGAHLDYVGDAAYALQQEDRYLKFGESTGKSLQALNEEIMDKTTAQPKKNAGKPLIPIGDEALNSYEGWMKSQVSANPRLSAIYEKYAEKINTIRSEKDDKMKVIRSRHIAGDFAMEAAKLGLDTPEPKSASSTPKATPSGVVKITSKAERDALAPGTKYIAPDGREYTKR